MPRTSRPGPAHLSARTKARKRALDVLFEADLRGDDPLDTLHDRTREADPPVREYTTTLVTGVVEHETRLDERLAACLSEGWSLDRMPRVDRVLARIAAWEIGQGDVPPRVAIAEALVLAGELSTDDSPAFLNGVLSALAQQPVMDEAAVEQVHAEQLDDAQP